MDLTFKELKKGKKLYFASDFHLGVPDKASSLVREKKIIRWLDQIKNDAAGIILVGDIFDFWFEYKHSIPKGFTRFLGKIAELKDHNIPIIFFTGNHDMWMFDYFPKEFDVPVYRKPVTFKVNEKLLHVGHGDGLGPGDHFYKFLKVFFNSKLCQWLFTWLHPNIGMGIAQYWSSKSRLANSDHEDHYKGDSEWLTIYCNDIEKHTHHDHYILGHRHLPLEIDISSRSKYFNLGEWVHHCTYLEFDGAKGMLKTFESGSQATK